MISDRWVYAMHENSNAYITYENYHGKITVHFKRPVLMTDGDLIAILNLCSAIIDERRKDE